MGGPLSSVADQAGKTAGKGFAANLASTAVSSLDSAGGRIVGALGTAFKFGAAAVAAGIATSIGLGLKRLVGIEEAQAKLRGLGHDAGTVDTIMGNALDSVRGTAFGLADAATLAATAVASGVKPGQDLERTLKLTGDAATIAGTDLAWMGDVFGRIAAGGKLTIGELRMLSRQGIPILQWIGDEFGVTADAAEEMVSRGEVDFATFQNLVEENIGGAALRSGETTMGAFKNMGAAAGRLGATLVGPVFAQARTFFQGAIGWIDGLTERVGPFAETVGVRLANAFSTVADVAGRFFDGLRGVAGDIDPITGQLINSSDAVRNFGRSVRDVFDRVSSAVRSGVEWFRENEAAVRRVVSAVGPAVGIVAGLAVSVNLVTRAWKLLKAATPIGIILLLTTALVYAWQNSETFRNVVTGAFGAVRGAVEGAAAAVSAASRWVADHGTALRNVAAVIGVVLVPTLVSMGAAFAVTVAGWVASGAAAAASAARQAAAWLLVRANQLAGIAVLGVINALTLLTWAQMAAASVKGAVKMAASWVIAMGPVGWVIAAVVALVALIVANWDTVVDWTKKAWTWVTDTIGKAWKWITDITGKAVQAVVGFFTNLRDRVVGFASNIRDRVTGFFGSMRDGVSSAASSVRDRVTSHFGSMRDRAVSAAQALRSGAQGAFDRLPGPVQAVLGRVASAVGDGFTRAKNLAAGALGLLKDVVRGDMDAVFDRIKGVKDRVVSFFANAGTWLVNAGKAILRGLTDGIKAMASAPVDAVKNVAGRIRNLLPGSPVKEGPLKTLNRGHAGGQIVKMVAAGMRANLAELQAAADATARAALPEFGAPGVPGLPSLRPAAAVRAATVAAPAGDGGQGPATFHLYDSDGVLMGTMRGVARQEGNVRGRDVSRGLTMTGVR